MAKTAREAARRLLEMQILEGAKAQMEELSGIPVADGATYHDYLNAKVLQMAKDGDKEAAELVRRYGLKSGSGGSE